MSTQDMRDNGCQEEGFYLTQTRDTWEERASTEEPPPSDWNCLHQITVELTCLWGHFLGCFDGRGSSPQWVVTPGPVGLGCVQKLAEQRQGASQ